MHELALCQALLATMTRLAAEHRARAVTRARLAIGPLSGAEPALIARAFELAKLGTLANAAELVIVERPARVACGPCRQEFAVAANRLLCPACGGAEVTLVTGDELILETLDLDIADAMEGPVAADHGTDQALAVAPG